MKLLHAGRTVIPLLIMILTLFLISGSLMACGQGQTTQTTTTATTSTSTITHAGLPLVTFDSGSFAGSGNCAVCHTNLIDAAGKDVSIDSAWRSTMMANAARDTYFRAKLSAEIKNAPHLQGTIEDVCATCHTPMARTQAVSDDTVSSLTGSGFFSSSNELHKAAIDGVSCTLCHQIQSTGLGEASTFAGKYVIDTSTVPPNRVIFSQFTNPQANMMASVSGFTPVSGKHLEDAGLCGTCHTVITPYIDSEGNVQGTFPEQTPFLEWLHSSYAGNTSCQSCHMPAASGDVATASMPANLDKKSPFRQHFFVGGNTQMLAILRDNPDDMAVTSSSANFNNSIVRASSQLQEDTSSVSVTDSRLDSQTLSVTVKVTNQTGHKFPTGFPSRRVWINFQVTDSKGNVVFESGKPGADGTIAGNAADADYSTYEPHYDVITAADQVQIYEAVMQDMEGGVTHKLLEASGYAKDNRLLPAGFDKATADDMIAVWGDARNDDNFIGGSDNVTYKVNTSGFKGPFTVTIKLYYQSLAYSSVHALSEFNTSEVQDFTEYYQASNRLPVLIYSLTQKIS